MRNQNSISGVASANGKNLTGRLKHSSCKKESEGNDSKIQLEKRRFDIMSTEESNDSKALVNALEKPEHNIAYSKSSRKGQMSHFQNIFLGEYRRTSLSKR